MDEKQDDKNGGERDEEGKFYLHLHGQQQSNDDETLRAIQQLLAQLAAEGPRAETFESLVALYARLGQEERVGHYLKLRIKYTSSEEELADCMLSSGQLAERLKKPKVAIAFYRRGLAYKSSNIEVLYFLNNNLAYCLNSRGKHREALDHARQAVDIDPSRPNAFKNLGISLLGLKRYAEAARAWIKAMHANVLDRRAFDLLEKLVAAKRKKILAEIPDIEEQLETCRGAMQTLQSGGIADWSKGLFMN